MPNTNWMQSTTRMALALVAALATTVPALAAQETPTEQANKQTVLSFYAALNAADATHTMKQRIRGIAEKYLSPAYTQHSAAFTSLPGPGTARDKLIRMFQNMPSAPAAAQTAPTTVAIMAEGDKVMMLTSRERHSPGIGTTQTAYIFNMFRVKDGQLVEHWDVSPGMSGPPPGAPAGGPPAPPAQ